jgi:hypothetical protein
MYVNAFPFPLNRAKGRIAEVDRLRRGIIVRNETHALVAMERAGDLLRVRRRVLPLVGSKP